MFNVEYLPLYPFAWTTPENIYVHGDCFPIFRKEIGNDIPFAIIGKLHAVCRTAYVCIGQFIHFKCSYSDEFCVSI